MDNQHENQTPNSDELKKKITEDMAHLYNYPSIGKLFSKDDSIDLQNIRSKLNATRERLDTIVRRGSNEESQKASKALTAISLTLDFLQNLEEKKTK